MDIISYGLASEAQTKAIQNDKKINDVDAAISQIIGNHEIRITTLRNDMDLTYSLVEAMGLKQVTKLEIVAPHVTKLAIADNIDFITRPVEVLKLQGSLTDAQDNVIKSVATFDNAQASDFVTDQLVIFDGVMKLNTSASSTTTSSDVFGNGTTVYSAPLIRPFGAKIMYTIEVN